MPTVRKSLLERFSLQWKSNLKTGCWLWTGAIHHSGYGVIRQQDGKSKEAHIVSWNLFRGEVPVGKELHHLCRIKHCVNPHHLEPLTYVEHRHRHAKTRCNHGHPFSENNTRFNPAGARVCITCARIASKKHYRRKLCLKNKTTFRE